MNNLKQYRLLDASEELALGRDIQKGVRCELVRDRLEARQGSVPTHDEWAAALGVKTQELLADLDAAKRAKRAMISANLRLVVSVAKRYRCKGIAFPDLIQEGTFGLVRASEKFDPELGFKFSTYATWWIKQSIMNGIGEHVNRAFVLYTESSRALNVCVYLTFPVWFYIQYSVQNLEWCCKRVGVHRFKHLPSL